jgi:P27 family predicted phage terminase small subunit
MRGRTPSPTALKVLKGNPGKRALPKDEPAASAVYPEPPEAYNDEQRLQWHSLASVFFRAKIISELDVHAFAELVKTVLEEKEYTKQIGTQFLITGPNGVPMRNPLLGLRDKARKRMDDLIKEFGGTPSSRTRVRMVAPDGKKKSKLQESKDALNAR